MTEIVKNATMKNPAFWVCLTITIGLFVAGFCVPPHGEIDGSVLTACGISSVKGNVVITAVAS